MSISYSAEAIIGVRVPREKMEKFWCSLQISPGCEHPLCDAIPKEDYNHCHICGAEVSKQFVVDDEEGMDDICISRKLGLLEVSFYSSDSDDFVVGRYLTRTGSSRSGGPHIVFARIPTLPEETYSEVRRDLEASGLWDPESFGLYAVLHKDY